MPLMKQPLNAEKSKKLRPVRILLAVLVAVLMVLILTNTSKPKTSAANHEETEAEENTEKIFYYVSGLFNFAEQKIEEKLKSLGVPEEEFENPSEYLSKDEIFELETKSDLAARLDETFLEIDEKGKKDLETIFEFDDEFFEDNFDMYQTEPEEYLSLKDLLDEYHKTLNTVEDYDIIEA